MSKAKKQALPREELLGQALVPENEQPYVVPGNWVWVKLNSCYEVTSSKRVFKDDWKEFGIPFYRTRELVVLSENGALDNELFISEKMYEEYSSTYGVPQSGDLLVSGVGTIGIPYVVQPSERFYFKDGNIIWFKRKMNICSEYIFYLFKSLFMINQIKGFSSGTTVDTYTIINAKNTFIPLPPSAEQLRIVERIESLFEKLDRAKELTQNALDSFETRKVAILHKAFIGELTAKWREENGVRMESWENKKLKELGCFKLGKMLDKAKNKGKHTKYLRNINVRWFGFDLEDVAFMAATDDDRVKFSVEPGDLFICEGGEPGRCAIWETPKSELIYQKALHRFRSNGLIVGKLLAYNILWLSKSDGLTQHFTGTTIKHLTGQSLAEIKINLPTLPEQQEIVRIFESLLDKEQRARELCDVIEKIDLMKKAILARAFRGELGTNDPMEASAAGLLGKLL